MGQILTLEELYARKGGGRAAVDALVSGAEDVEIAKEKALADAEHEARRELGRRYVWPTDPSAAPDSLKALIARAFPYHARRSVAPSADLKDELRFHETDVLSVYRAVAARDVDLEGMVERKAAGRRLGKAVKPPPDRRPVDAGAMSVWRRRATGYQEY